MSELRRALAWLFAIEALVSTWLAVSFFHTNALIATRLSTLSPLKTLLVVALLAVFAIIPTVFAAAAWTVLKRKPSARTWGIAASVVQCIVGIPLLYRHFRMPVSIAVGITGLIAFSRRAPDPPVEPDLSPILGDGTNRYVNKLVWIVGCVTWYVGMTLWYRWANSHDLHFADNSLSFIVEILVATILTITVHELGHAAAGTAFGMKLRSFMIGPFRWQIRDGRWKFRFLPKAFLSLGGATGVVPVNPQQSHWEQICMIAAGPFTNLCAGLLAFYATITAPGHSWERAWHLFALFTTMSLILGVLNLVPFQTKTVYSDGALIYQLLSGGPWADYHRTISTTASSLVTPLRPRDYDIEAIQRAARSIAQSARRLHMFLLASTYYLDNGRHLEALRELNKAETIYQESTPDIPVGFHHEFIFGKALLQRDAASAHLWWERMEAKKPDRNWDYWRSRCALLWIEGHQEEAYEAWNIGYALVLQLPVAGANEFHKDMFLLLRKALDGLSTEAGEGGLPTATATETA